MNPTSPTPWHREPWTWILMSGPFIVVVAGIVTMYLAVATSDGLVADDYYKQGLGINRAIERDERARALGMSASLQFSEDRTHVRVFLRGAGTPPGALQLTLAHRTRAGEDQAVTLPAIAPGVFEGTLAAPRGALWRLGLGDAGRAWRLSGDWPAGAASVLLEPAAR